jgi:hypothetical protein
MDSPLKFDELIRRENELLCDADAEKKANGKRIDAASEEPTAANKSELNAKTDAEIADNHVKSASSDPAGQQENKSLSTGAQKAGEVFKEIALVPPGPAGEPWVRLTPIDRVGLAFSGGGIRSATFNLGVLKALHELQVLAHVDYLSTVSGGGYIGGWWSAWRARTKTHEFPIARQTVDPDKLDETLNREPEEVRHLREFSNFLSPRIGFFQSETWNAIMAVLSAVVPAVLVASSVIAVSFLVWLGINSVILADALKIPTPAVTWPDGLTNLVVKWFSLDRIRTVTETLHVGFAPLLLIVITVGAYFFCERSWQRAGKAEGMSSGWGKFWVWLAMPLLIAVGILLGWPLLSQLGLLDRKFNGVCDWKWATGLRKDEAGLSFSPYLFAAPILWAAIALIVFLPRVIIMRVAPVRVSGKVVSAIDRALSQMLGAAVIVTVVGFLWLTGCWLKCDEWGTKISAGGALVSGGVFAFLRNWIGRLSLSKKAGFTDLIKPLIPQILAYIAIALWAICIAVLLAELIGHGISPWAVFIVAAGIILGAITLFDPAQVSLHSFYRNRISRAYLGASNREAVKSAEENRQTEVRRYDDIQLHELSPTGAPRPIHLVCCAANDLAGDHLDNLSRGSRSAVLSKFGFAIGNYFHSWEKEKKRPGHESLGLGSAITASAAAFNSNMGSLSMTLGAGVTFLCTALNLRLGLWLPHPVQTEIDGAPKVFPGFLFIKEMFGLTNSGLRPALGTSNPKSVAKYVHLSDGGHFENLALYELVRRHCRYIIVSDCGADPQVAFDDFGNAVRRIREDFGVEIDIDLAPLKPNASRLSKQHVAVGAIMYDPRGAQKDTGVLVYLKPTLTGDEPCDISQYRTRNEDFPHETTGDQFYDEAQWESYRRLGEHAARSAFRFVERERSPDKLTADDIFNGARWEWYQSQDRREEKILELNGRLTALEQQLQTQAPPAFLREMYPELGTFDKRQPSAQPAPQEPAQPNAQPTPAATTQPTSEEAAERTSRILHLLIQMIQLMEDVWISASLETHWNDPNLLGWMNTFQRWAYTPSFRLWWPILKPMYGRKFRRFMEERLSLADEDYPETVPKVIPCGNEIPHGVAETYWKRMQLQKERSPHTVYSFELELTDQREEAGTPARGTQIVQVGLAFIDTATKPGTACWSTEDFFIPPSLWGAGLGRKFLNGLLKVLWEANVTRCEVTVQPPPDDAKSPIPWIKRTDLASRQQLNDLLAFYSRAHFALEVRDDNGKEDKTLVCDLTEHQEEFGLSSQHA